MRTEAAYVNYHDDDSAGISMKQGQCRLFAGLGRFSPYLGSQNK